MTNKSKTVAISKKDDKVVSIKEKQPSIEEVRKVLDAQIEAFQRKAKLIGDRDQFLHTKDEILNYISEQGVDYDPSMDSQRLTLVLKDNRSYRGENVVSISNNEVIRNMMNILLDKINGKITEIEKEILV